jgi:hypothetical protein
MKTQKIQSTIDVQDIIEVLEHNNIATPHQIYLLEILNLALFKKQYPQDTTGKLQMKIQLLKDTLEMVDETHKEKHKDSPCIKVRAVVILLMLNELGIGSKFNDLTKICKFISALTNGGYTSIYTEMQRGINFSKRHHSKQIDEVNKILLELNASISIDIQKRY